MVTPRLQNGAVRAGLGSVDQLDRLIVLNVRNNLADVVTILIQKWQEPVIGAVHDDLGRKAQELSIG